MDIRAVAFDLGGVIGSLGDPETHRRWERRLDLKEHSLMTQLWSNPAAKRGMVGQTTLEELWDGLAQWLSTTRDEVDRLLGDVWAKEFDEELLDYVRALRATYKTALISNAFLNTRDLVKDHVNGQTFDVILFSAEEGVRKPDPEIFARALSRLEVAPEEMIFVDDLPPNVEAASALGMHGILFRDSRQARDEIDRLLGR